MRMAIAVMGAALCLPFAAQAQDVLGWRWLSTDGSCALMADQGMHYGFTLSADGPDEASFLILVNGDIKTRQTRPEAQLVFDNVVMKAPAKVEAMRFGRTSLTVTFSSTYLKDFATSKHMALRVGDADMGTPVINGRAQAVYALRQCVRTLGQPAVQRNLPNAVPADLATMDERAAQSYFQSQEAFEAWRRQFMLNSHMGGGGEFHDDRSGRILQGQDW